MKGFYFEIGQTVATVLQREFTNRDFRLRWRKRPTTDMVPFFTPNPPAQTVSFQVVESGGLVKTPVRIYSSVALKIRP